MPDPRPIDPDDLPRFGIDSDNRLYWDGKVVNTTTSLTLTSPQSRFAKFVVAAAFAGSLATIANAAASWATYVRNGRVKQAPAAQNSPQTATTNKSPAGASDGKPVGASK